MSEVYDVIVNESGKTIEVWQLLYFKDDQGKHWYRIGIFNKKSEEGVISIPFKRRKTYRSLRGFRKGVELFAGKTNWNTPARYDWKDIDDMQRFLHDLGSKQRMTS